MDNDLPPDTRRPYQPPAVTSEDTFEVRALACGGGKESDQTFGCETPFVS